jgi:hypothetical protein
MVVSGEPGACIEHGLGTIKLGGVAHLLEERN